MRWAFWRQEPPQPRPAAARRAGPAARTRTPRDAAGRRATTPDRRRAHAGFSGATPAPGGSDSLLARTPGDLSGLSSVADVDVPGPGRRARGRAACVGRCRWSGTAPAAARVLERLEETRAGRARRRRHRAWPPGATGWSQRPGPGGDDLAAGSDASAAVVAQGDTVAGRAQTLLRTWPRTAPRPGAARRSRLGRGSRQDPALVHLRTRPLAGPGAGGRGAAGADAADGAVTSTRWRRRLEVGCPAEPPRPERVRPRAARRG
jgi:hypothetical protein